jgi:exonuclease III
LIRNLDEKRGGIRHLEPESGDFQNILDNTNLIDLETSNGTFTWTNRRTKMHQIACRLDRFLISDSLLLEGTTLEVSILDFHGSDHWPIQLWLDVSATPGKKPFRFE